MTDQNSWDNYDIHGVVGVRVAAGAPGAAQLRAMLACFRTEEEVPGDVVLTHHRASFAREAQLEGDLRYGPDRIEFVREAVQIERTDGQYVIRGAGELLTTLVPVLDRVMVERGVAMFHAATVAWHGSAIALPAAGGTGKTSTIAKLMKCDGFSFMGDDWAFLTRTGDQLNYDKPMFIKPHHRDIYPHLFHGARKPLVPVRLSRPVGRLTTRVHPLMIRYPRLADLSRRWSPEHRMLPAAVALPGVVLTDQAPLALCAFIERHGGDCAEVTAVTPDWMASRMMGNFHIEMPQFSQSVVTALAATSVVPWHVHVNQKQGILRDAVAAVPNHLIRIPAHWSPDRASDSVVDALMPLVSGIDVRT